MSELEEEAAWIGGSARATKYLVWFMYSLSALDSLDSSSISLWPACLLLLDLPLLLLLTD